MEQENGNNKPGKVIAECPCCHKKFRDGQEEKLVVTQYLLPPTPGTTAPQIGLPKIACTACGIEFFPPKILAEIAARAKGETSRIIAPSPGIILNG